MADGFALQIDDDLARKLEHGAKAAGMTREDYARFLLDQQTFNYDDYTWINGNPREPTVPSLNEVGVSWSDLKVELIERLEAKLRDRA